MNLVLHAPQGEENVLALQKRVAAVQAQAIAGCLRDLPCSGEQKRAVLQKVQALLEPP